MIWGSQQVSLRCVITSISQHVVRFLKDESSLPPASEPEGSWVSFQCCFLPIAKMRMHETPKYFVFNTSASSCLSFQLAACINSAQTLGIFSWIFGGRWGGITMKIYWENPNLFKTEQKTISGTLHEHLSRCIVITKMYCNNTMKGLCFPKGMLSVLITLLKAIF